MSAEDSPWEREARQAAELFCEPIVGGAGIVDELTKLLIGLMRRAAVENVKMAAKLVAAKEELAELREDKARLDWLERTTSERAVDVSRHRARWGVCVQRMGGDGHGDHFGRGNDLRAAVDAARSREGGKGG